MSRPDYIRYNSEPEHLKDQMAWFVMAEEAARDAGCTFCRSGVSPCGRQLILEGWKAQPERVPEPQFAFVDATAGEGVAVDRSA